MKAMPGHPASTGHTGSTNQLDIPTRRLPVQPPRPVLPTVLGRTPLYAHWLNLNPLEPPDSAPRMTDLRRIVVASLALLVFLLGFAPLGAISLVLRIAFLQFAGGLGLCLLARQRVQHRVAVYTLTLGPSALILLTTLMARLGWWQVEKVIPWWLGVSLVALLAALAVSVWHYLTRLQSTERFQIDWEAAFVGALTVVGWVTAVFAARLHAGDPQPKGMALTAGPLWFAGMAVVIAALLRAVLRVHRALPITVLAVTSVTTVSQAAMYDLPTVIVAGRHVGLGVYLDSYGAIVPADDIYQAWIGLFASTAFITRAVGLAEPLAYANWWGALSAPVLVLVVRSVAGRWLPPAQSWLAAMIFGLGSSLTTPFYAPQVYGFIAAFVVVTLVAGYRDWVSGRQNAVRIATAVMISAAMAVSHQLSPYLISVALFALVAARLIRPWWLPGVVLVPAMGWMIVNLSVVSRYISPEAFGRVLGNLSPPEHPPPPVGIPWENRVTFLSPALLLVGIGLLALWRWKQFQHRLSLAFIAAAASPVLIMALTDYGSEGIFRVTLFALPWLAMLASMSHWARRAITPRQRRVKIGTAAAIVGMVAVNTIGLTGMDWARIIRADDVNSVRYYERTAPWGSYFVTAGSQLATPAALTENYMVVNYLSRESVLEYFDPGRRQIYPVTTGDAYDADADLQDLTTVLLQGGAPEYYLYVSDATMAYNYRYGLQRPGDYQRLRAAVDRSRDWKLEYASGNSKLYRYVGERPDL